MSSSDSPSNPAMCGTTWSGSGFARHHRSLKQNFSSCADWSGLISGRWKPCIFALRRALQGAKLAQPGGPKHGSMLLHHRSQCLVW